MSTPKRITVTLEDDQYVGLQEVAEDAGIGLSDAARVAINHYLLNQHWGQTIGKVAKAAIRDGKTNEQTLEIVRGNFAHANTTISSISWYRSQLRKEDPNVFSDAQARHASSAG